MVIDQIDGQCWSAVVTYRDEHVPIISVRRSREGEVAIYEANEFDERFDAGEDMAAARDTARVGAVATRVRDRQIACRLRRG
jgi:hypothetical protein